MFSDADLSKKFEVSIWVYSPGASARRIVVGAYGNKGHEYATSPIASQTADVPADTWTKISFEYEHTENGVTQIGVGQSQSINDAAIAPTIYFDDIEIEEIK